MIPEAIQKASSEPGVNLWLVRASTVSPAWKFCAVHVALKNLLLRQYVPYVVIGCSCITFDKFNTSFR